MVFSGTCICGHQWTDHYLVMVEDPEDVVFSGPSQSPHECEFYGRNEKAGLDDAGQPHCFSYVDRDDPDPIRHVRWRQALEAERRGSSPGEVDR